MEEQTPQQTEDVQQPAEEPQQGAAPTPQVAEEPQQPSAGEQRPIAEFPQQKKKTDAHSITIRSAVRIFEDAKTPRSPRTIVNYCNPNTESVSRLDCWQDPKDRAYYITLESIEEVIAEEKAKGRFGNIPQPELRNTAPVQQPSATPQQGAAHPQQGAEMGANQMPQSDNNTGAELRELRRTTIEQEHTITGKDIVIEQLQQAWDKLAERLERQSELVGGLSLENRQLKALQAPREQPQVAEVRGGEQDEPQSEETGENEQFIP